MKKDKKIKFYLGLIYLAILSLFLWYLFTNFSIKELTSYEFIKNNRNNLIALKDDSFILTSILFIVFLIIWVLLLGFATPVLLISGFLFDKWYGTLFSIIGISLGSTLLYLFASFFFRDVIQEKFSKRFSNLKEKFEQNELIYFIIYRFIGGIPMQIQNLIPVIFSVKTKNYFLGSFIGMTPQIFIWTFLGSGIENIINKNIKFPSIIDLILSPDIYIPIILFITVIILALILRRFFFPNLK